MGIDFGERRIGIALSDTLGMIAFPHDTLLRREGKRFPLHALATLAEERKVRGIAVGLPLPLEGDESSWCLQVRELGRSLGERTGLPIHFIDERMTSVRAERAIRGSGLPKGERERKDRIDSAAAAIILQLFLDRRRSETP